MSRFELADTTVIRMNGVNGMQLYEKMFTC